MTSFDEGRILAAATPLEIAFTTSFSLADKKRSTLKALRYFDKSSPLLYNALTKGETLTNVELKWYRTSYTGKPEHYFSVVLEDAVIVDIQASMDSELGLTVTDVAPLENVSFAYRKITWRHETASTSGEDDWRIGVGKNA